MKRRDILCATTSSTTVNSGGQDRPPAIRLGTQTQERSSSKPSTPSREPPFSPRLLLQKFRKSSADIRDWAAGKKLDFRRKSFANSNDLRSPSSSSRELLSQTPKPRRKPDFDFDRSSSLIVDEPTKRGSNYVPSRASSALVKKTMEPPSQVVVLKVSIHCKGCEGKVRRHISKMEGVTSFSIDMESKKVTVVGDVTASAVLENISKVKKAQLWPSSSSSNFRQFDYINR